MGNRTVRQRVAGFGAGVLLTWVAAVGAIVPAFAFAPLPWDTSGTTINTGPWCPGSGTSYAIRSQETGCGGPAFTIPSQARPAPAMTPEMTSRPPLQMGCGAPITDVASAQNDCFTEAGHAILEAQGYYDVGGGDG